MRPAQAAAHTIGKGAARRLRRDGRDDCVEQPGGAPARPSGQRRPARATTKLLGIEAFEDDLARVSFSDLSHWGYGTGWGIVRGALAAAGLRPLAATAAHGVSVWGSAQIMLPALEVAPPAIFWAKEEIAVYVLHHTVYALATGIAYTLLDAPRRDCGRASANPS